MARGGGTPAISIPPIGNIFLILSVFGEGYYSASSFVEAAIKLAGLRWANSGVIGDMRTTRIPVSNGPICIEYGVRRQEEH